jgi:hypothetical protein
LKAVSLLDLFLNIFFFFLLFRALIDPHTHQPRQIGFVKFFNVEDAKEAVKVMNDYKINDTAVPWTVCFVESDEEKEKRNNLRKQKSVVGKFCYKSSINTELIKNKQDVIKNKQDVIKNSHNNNNNNINNKIDKTKNLQQQSTQSLFVYIPHTDHSSTSLSHDCSISGHKSNSPLANIPTTHFDSFKAQPESNVLLTKTSTSSNNIFPSTPISSVTSKQESKLLSSLPLNPISNNQFPNPSSYSSSASSSFSSHSSSPSLSKNSLPPPSSSPSLSKNSLPPPSSSPFSLLHTPIDLSSSSSSSSFTSYSSSPSLSKNSLPPPFSLLCTPIDLSLSSSSSSSSCHHMNTSSSFNPVNLNPTSYYTPMNALSSSPFYNSPFPVYLLLSIYIIIIYYMFFVCFSGLFP